jgi:hypothetical protein
LTYPLTTTTARALRAVDTLRCVLDSRAWREWHASDLYYNRVDHPRRVAGVVERAIHDALASQDAPKGAIT